MTYFILLISFSFLFLGCQPPSQQARDFHNTSNETLVNEEKVERFIPFYVYKDGDSKNRYTASGYMPNGKCVRMNQMYDQSCVSGTCIEITFDLVCSRADQHWAGVYWLNPADNWGQQKGGYNLEGAKRLVFQARGLQGEERIEEFKMGGVGLIANYPDTDYAGIGPVILTDDWREYVIDLRGKNLAHITGGFAWAANADISEKDTLTFFLDEIRYE